MNSRAVFLLLKRVGGTRGVTCVTHRLPVPMDGKNGPRKWLFLATSILDHAFDGVERSVASFLGLDGGARPSRGAFGCDGSKIVEWGRRREIDGKR